MTDTDTQKRSEEMISLDDLRSRHVAILRPPEVRVLIKAIANTG